VHNKPSPLSVGSNKWLLSAAVILLIVVSTLTARGNPGESYIDGSFKRALVGFALARGLNGVISVAQGTEFSLTPAGMGINLAPGEILDPINDLVERFSWIMLLSSSALGVQKVLLSMSVWQGLLIAVIVSGLALLATFWVRQTDSHWIQNWLMRLFMLLLIMRFMMPIVSVANEWVYRTFLEQDYQTASANLEQARSQIVEINKEVMTEQETDSEGGLLDRARDILASAKKRLDFNQKLDEYGQAAEAISENTIHLIVVFLMQTIVFPLLFMWIVYVLVKKIFI